MLVKWNEDRIKAIPKNDGMGMVILAPGYNDILDTNWAKCRDRVLDRIAKADIVEEWTRIPPEQKEDYPITQMDSKILYAPAKLSDINRPRVMEVIKETYHVPTLNKWLDDDLRQDVRLMIMKQLVVVDKGNEDSNKVALAAAMSKVG